MSHLKDVIFRQGERIFLVIEDGGSDTVRVRAVDASRRIAEMPRAEVLKAVAERDPAPRLAAGEGGGS